MNKISQKDIAKALGISLITVQRAFSNTGYVSDKLKKYIFSYADEIGYQPSRTAKALVSKKIRKIALFSECEPLYFWNDIEKGAKYAYNHIAEFNYEVTYHRIPSGDTDAYIRTLETMKNENYNAIGLVSAVCFDMGRITSYLEQINIPYIFFNNKERSFNELCYIGPDYEKGGALAANFLSSCGNQIHKTAIITHLEDSNNSRLNNSFMREKGFRNYAFNNNNQNLTYGVHIFKSYKDSEIMVAELMDFFKANPDTYDSIYYISSEHDVLIKVLKKIGIER